MNLCSTINVHLHPGRGNDILDVTGDVPDPTAILDANGFYARKDSKTDLIFSSRLYNVEKSIVTQRLITD